MSENRETSGREALILQSWKTPTLWIRRLAIAPF